MILVKLEKKILSNTKKNAAGFTLMEIIVATTIFAIVVSAMMALFNYTLKINRRTEALRQATQGMRNFIEFVVKEVRNGSIDYGVNNGQTANPAYPVGPCLAPTINGGPQVGDTYGQQSNTLAVATVDGDLECFYLGYGYDNTAGKSAGDYVGNGIFASTGNNPHPVLALQKNSLTKEILSSPNISVQRLVFLVRPVCDPYSPYCSSYGGYPLTQPFVTILAEFLVTLPTGEQTVIYYQTTASSEKYDIPSN